MQPPASLPLLAEPLYETFYGLREQPFALSTDPRFLFMSASHRRAYEELLTGLKRREGLLLITGETGTGKTTLCRGVIESLGGRTFSALILNPYMSGAEVLRVILRDFGLVSREEIRRGAFARADVPQLLDGLESFLRTLRPLNSYAVVVIDEAQSLSPEVLDQIRMLGAFEHKGQRLLQIVLGGQPALLKTLQSEPMLALNERITRRAVLSALPPLEVEGYIQHRLAVAGGQQSVSFSLEAMRLVSELSRGLPRRINVICDRALEEGRVEGTTTITPELVKRAAKAVAGARQTTSAFERPSPVVAAERVEVPINLGVTAKSLGNPRRLLLVAAGAVLMLSVLGAAFYAQSIVTRDPGVPPPPPPPRLNTGRPAVALPLPSDEDLIGLPGWKPKAAITP